MVINRKTIGKCLMCVICFEEYDGDEHKPIMLTECGHTICRNCISSLVKFSNPPSWPVCPCCRKEFYPNTYRSNYAVIGIMNAVNETEHPISEENIYLEREINKQFYAEWSNNNVDPRIRTDYTYEINDQDFDELSLGEDSETEEFLAQMTSVERRNIDCSLSRSSLIYNSPRNHSQSDNYQHDNRNGSDEQVQTEAPIRLRASAHPFVPRYSNGQHNFNAESTGIPYWIDNNRTPTHQSFIDQPSIAYRGSSHGNFHFNPQSDMRNQINPILSSPPFYPTVQPIPGSHPLHSNYHPQVPTNANNQLYSQVEPDHSLQLPANYDFHHHPAVNVNSQHQHQHLPVGSYVYGPSPAFGHMPHDSILSSSNQLVQIDNTVPGMPRICPLNDAAGYGSYIPYQVPFDNIPFSPLVHYSGNERDSNWTRESNEISTSTPVPHSRVAQPSRGDVPPFSEGNARTLRHPPPPQANERTEGSPSTRETVCEKIENGLNNLTAFDAQMLSHRFHSLACVIERRNNVANTNRSQE